MRHCCCLVAQSCLSLCDPMDCSMQAYLSITNSRSLLKLISIESVMPSSHLILCHPFPILSSIVPSIRIFSNESVLPIKWPKYWSFSFSPSDEYSGLISFRIDWFDPFAVQGTLKSLLQHHSSKWSRFFFFFFLNAGVGVCHLLGCVWLFATPWTAAHQAPLSKEFYRQEYWNWGAILFPRGFSSHRGQTWATREAHTHQNAAAAAAQSLQLCSTLCDPIDGSPPGSPVPGILQARTLEWVAISFSNAWNWKVKVNSLSRVRLLATPWTVAHQAPPSMGFSRQEYWSGVPLPSPPMKIAIIKRTNESEFSQEGVEKGNSPALPVGM